MLPFDFPLTKDLEIDGHWWLPSNLQTRVAGKLKYSSTNGLWLDCGSPLIPSDNFAATRPVAVHGDIDSTSQKATLFEAVGRSARLMGPRTQKISAAAFVAGEHIDSLDSPVERISLMLDGLRDWISNGSFGINYEGEQADEDGRFRFQYVVEDEANVGFDVESLGARVSFCFYCETRGGGHKITLEQDYGISVSFNQSTSIRQAITVAHDVELLFTLLTGAPTYIDCFFIGDSTRRPAMDRYLLYARNRSPDSDRMYNQQFMPVNYDLVSSILPDVLERWFSICDKYRAVLNLLRSSLFNPDSGTTESRFLNLAQAMEGYCRIRDPEKYYPKKEFAEFSGLLLTNLSSQPTELPADFDVAKAMASKIQHLNDFTLNHRLVSLVRQHSWLEVVLSSRSSTGDAVSVEEFMRNVKDARNRLIHVDSGGQTSGAIAPDTDWRLRVMLCLLLLNDLGIDVPQRLAAFEDKLPILWWRYWPRL